MDRIIINLCRNCKKIMLINDICNNCLERACMSSIDLDELDIRLIEYSRLADGTLFGLVEIKYNEMSTRVLAKINGNPSPNSRLKVESIDDNRFVFATI